MNREIKFRAYFENKFYFFTLNEIMERAATYQGSWDLQALRAEKQQYTGLKDKNGKEIYENDIVEAIWYNRDEPENKTIGKVIFNKGWLSFCIWNEPEGTMSEMNGQGYYTWEIKVIGNFYENPELMELILY